MTTISFYVHGIAKPAGSKRGFALKKNGVYTGRVAISDDCVKSRDWKTDVSIKARASYSGPLLDGPLSMTLKFYMPRPKGHFGSGKNAQALKASSPGYPTGKPDLLKLTRGVEDALTGIIWHDDAQVVHEVLDKVYEEQRSVTGVLITVERMAERVSRENGHMQRALGIL